MQEASPFPPYQASRLFLSLRIEGGPGENRGSLLNQPWLHAYTAVQACSSASALHARLLLFKSIKQILLEWFPRTGALPRPVMYSWQDMEFAAVAAV